MKKICSKNANKYENISCEFSQTIGTVNLTLKNKYLQMKNKLILLILCFITMQWSINAQVPVIFRVSEGVKPGSLVTLYGEYLTGTPTIVFIKKDGSTAATATIAQSDLTGNGRICTVLFPNIYPGSYLIKATNSSGQSTSTAFVNKAEPRWLWKERMYPSMKNKLLGRNLDASEFGGSKNTTIRFVPTGGGTATTITADSVSNLCVDFTVPVGLASGNYYIETNTNSAEYGSEWIRLDNHFFMPATIVNTVVSCESAPSNATALTLGVAWSNDFNWTNQVNISAALGNGTTDATSAIKNAITTVVNNGGGVVYIPSGTYKITSTLTLGTKCILMGESNTSVTLVYSPSSNQSMITGGTLTGLCNLKITLASGFNKLNDAWIVNFGDDWYRNIPGAVANRYFIYNIILDLGLTNPDNSKVRSFFAGGRGPVLVKNNQIKGCSYGNHMAMMVYTNADMIDNKIEATSGFVAGGSRKTMFTGNDISIRTDLVGSLYGSVNGLFPGLPDVGASLLGGYIAHNYIHDMVGNGDGQPWALDGGGFHMDGFSDADNTSTSVKLKSGITSGNDGDLKWANEWSVIVTGGKGQGQVRRVVSKQSETGNPIIYTINIWPAWDVIPDATSHISFSRPHTGYDFDNNRAVNCNGFSGFYRVAYDCAVNKDYGSNTSGLYVWGNTSANNTGNSMFVQVRNSTFSGNGPHYGPAGLGIRAENEGNNTVSQTIPGVYGTEFRNNYINKRAGGTPLFDLQSTICGIGLNGIKSGSIVATLIEGNTFENAQYGVGITRSTNTVTHCNILVNTPTLFGTSNAQYFLDIACNIFTDTTKPIDSAITLLNNSIPVGSSDDDDYELGMKFRSTQAGQITKIRYYKPAGETGTHIGRIWSATGTQLASVTFTGETTSGWQEMALATPLNISANTTYVVSVNNNSLYAVTSNGLQSSISNGSLSTVADGANGVYNDTPGLFPSETWNNSNYFRDVVFVSNIITGVNKMIEKSEIQIYPNPSNGIIFIKAPEKSSVEIIDLLGRKLYNGIMKTNIETIDLTGLHGVFMVKINEETIKKIIVR
jgi:hypothetical protein